MTQSIKVLDHGYVRFVEAWGTGDAGDPLQTQPIRVDDGWDWESPDYECGIIEAARQSTQASFRGWKDKNCPRCHGIMVEPGTAFPEGPGDEYEPCKECSGKGYLPGDDRLLKTLFCGKPQHATPFEFSGMVIEVQAPIFVYREWHRHRTQSYNEMSARYAPLPDLYYVPDWEVLKSRGEAGEKTRNKQAAGTHPWNPLISEQWHGRLPSVYEYLRKVYNDALLAGVPKEIARIALPFAQYSRMRAAANLRNWLAFMTLRADPQAQWEIQQYANAVGTIIADKFPRTWALYQEAKNPKPDPAILSKFDLKILQDECNRRIEKIAQGSD